MAGHGHGCALNKKKVGHLLMLQRGTDGWIGGWLEEGKGGEGPAKRGRILGGEAVGQGVCSGRVDTFFADDRQEPRLWGKECRAR
jgi:hypothetical protein